MRLIRRMARGRGEATPVRLLLTVLLAVAAVALAVWALAVLVQALV